jgi:transcriptional regulator with XRE-family HTH domain
VSASITSRRHALGLTQAELAELAGVGITTVATAESGRATVRTDALLRILNALGLVLAVGPKPAFEGIRGVATASSR